MQKEEWQILEMITVNKWLVAYCNLISPNGIVVDNGLLKRVGVNDEGNKKSPLISGDFVILEEASTRFELVHDGFADRSLTAWVRRLKKVSCLGYFEI